MKRMEYLLYDIRESTDNRDRNGIKDSEIIQYFNDGSAYIQSLVFKHMPKPVYFLDKFIYETTNVNAEYPLPSNIYASGAISTLEAKFGQSTINEGFRALKRVFQEDSPDFFGYLSYGNTLRVTGTEINLAIEALRLWYFKKVRRFDKRWGVIQTLIPNTSITAVAASYDSELANINDIVSIVDANGVVIRDSIVISSFASNVLNTADDLTGVSPGQFIVSGGYSSTVSDLPSGVEVYLKDYVRQRIYTRNNYNDAGKQVFFTNKQEEDIISLFSQPSKEIDVPPITDVEYLDL